MRVYESQWGRVESSGFGIKGNVRVARQGVRFGASAWVPFLRR